MRGIQPFFLPQSWPQSLLSVKSGAPGPPLSVVDSGLLRIIAAVVGTMFRNNGDSTDFFKWYDGNMASVQL